MSHREQLLSAARQCLEQRGYARTTARDLVAASGTNLASIGYHFGSKEALLNEAMLAAFTEYADKLLALARAACDPAGPQAAAGGGTHPRDHIRQSWIAMVEEFTNIRALMVAFVEAMAQAERNPELRSQLAEGYDRLRATVAAAVTEREPAVSEDCARAIASFMIAVCDGLMMQWLLDPERTPSGAEAFDVASLIFSAGTG